MDKKTNQIGTLKTSRGASARRDDASADEESTLQRYRDLLMMSMDWFWETGPDHAITWFLEAPRHPLALGRTFWDIADTDDQPPAGGSLKRTMDHHRPFSDYQFCITHADGRRKWYSLNGRPHADADGHFAGYRGSLVDITDSRRAATDLSETQTLYHRLLDTTQEGFWRLDLSDKIVEINPAMCRMLGRERGDILGRSIYDFLDSANAEIQQVETNLRHMGVTGSHEISLSRADGDQIPLLCSATPIYDGDNRLVGLAGFYTDVTPLKDIQRRLETAHIEAEAANRAKSSFLSTMSHELRTPLNAIIGFSQLLTMLYKDVLDDAGIDKLNSITRAGQTLHDILSRILDLSKIQSERLAADLTELDALGVIDPVVQDTAALAHEHRVRVVVDRESLAGRLLLADRAGLGEALTNLIGNAIQYNRPDGAVTIEGAVRGDRFRITIHDTGYGIPPDQQGQVFQSFTRLNRYATDIGGAGIGLAVSKALVHAMGGEIGFSSRPAKGSSFWIDLPSVEQAPTGLDPRAPTRPRNEPTGRKPTKTASRRPKSGPQGKLNPPPHRKTATG